SGAASQLDPSRRPVWKLLRFLAAARDGAPLVFDFLVRRVIISIVTLVVITLIVFTGVRLIPGDPARVMAGTDADPAGLEEIRQKYGLGDPVLVQYLRWLGLAVRGDLGESIRTRESVVLTVSRKLPITIELACLAVLIA